MMYTAERSMLTVTSFTIAQPEEWPIEDSYYCPGCNDERPQVYQDARAHTCSLAATVYPTDALIVTIVRPQALERPLSDNTDDIDLNELPF